MRCTWCTVECVYTLFTPLIECLGQRPGIAPFPAWSWWDLAADLCRAFYGYSRAPRAMLYPDPQPIPLQSPGANPTTWRNISNASSTVPKSNTAPEGFAMCPPTLCQSPSSQAFYRYLGCIRRHHHTATEPAIAFAVLSIQ